ncbi:MAG: DUF503 domain-containing protein [Phycisphaerales bacterium JB059]
MVIGVLQFELHVHGAESLKDKRRVVKSVRDRLHREHLVSVAEVGALETLNLALMGVAVVGTEGARVAKVLDAFDAKLRALTDAELGSTRREIIRGEQLTTDPDAPLDENAIAAELLDRAENIS